MAEEKQTAPAEATDAGADAEAAAKAAPAKPVLEKGVNSCFSVVSSAVRKGKGAGKGLRNAGGGYVPAHLAHLQGPADAAAAADAPVEGGSGSPAPAAEAADAASSAGAASPMQGDAASGPGSLPSLTRADSFDSTASATRLQTSGSFDEAADGGVKKRAAKRWQRRAAVAATTATETAAAPPAAATAASSAAAVAPAPAEDTQAEEEPAAKRQKASPPASPLGDAALGQDGNLGSAAEVPVGSPQGSPVGSGDAGAETAPIPSPSPADPAPPPSPFAQSPAPASAEAATLAKLSVSKLKSLARYHGVNIAGCLEKAEMVAALRKAGLDDAAAEKEMERARGTSEPAKPADARTELEKENERKAAEFREKRAAAKVAEAEERARAAEEEIKRLRAEVEGTKTSSKKKWTPAFQSTPYISGQEERKDATFGDRFGERSSQSHGGFDRARTGNHPFAARDSPFGKGGIRGAAPKGGVDLRFQGGGAGGKGGPGFDICWEFKSGRCNKGAACRWKHV